MPVINVKTSFEPHLYAATGLEPSDKNVLPTILFYYWLMGRYFMWRRVSKIALPVPVTTAKVSEHHKKRKLYLDVSRRHVIMYDKLLHAFRRSYCYCLYIKTHVHSTVIPIQIKPRISGVVRRVVMQE